MELLISEYPSLSLGCFNQINLNLITTETLKIVRHEIVSYGLPYDFTHIDTKRLFIHNFIMNVCNTKKLNVHDRFTYVFNHTEFLPEIVDIVEEIIKLLNN